MAELYLVLLYIYSSSVLCGRQRLRRINKNKLIKKLFVTGGANSKTNDYWKKEDFIYL